MRKVPAVLGQLTGITVTQSALTQAALRLAQGQVGTAYEELRQAVRTRRKVNTDDTGWKVGGQPAQLMGFETEEERVYHRPEGTRPPAPQ